MASLVSSSTFVGAVLEHAGYVTQARFLTVLQDFFLEAGAFLYTLGAVGAIISYMMYGSFRAARYFLIGPALFWFLVGPRYDYDGVIWQVGGGMPRGMNQQRGEGASKADVKEAVERAKQPGVTQVARGFAIFAGPISELTRGLVDILLNEEDGHYLHHLSRARSFEYAIAATPYDATLVEMLEGNMVAGCGELYSISVALSAEELRPEAIGRGGVADVGKLQQRIDDLKARFARIENTGVVTPNAATKRFMRALWDIPENDPRLEKISCKTMWDLITSSLNAHAVKVTTQILDLAQGDGSAATPGGVAGARDRGCKFLMEKFNNSAAGNCEESLRKVVAAYLLRNALKDRRSGARFVERLVAERESQGGVPAGTLMPQIQPPTGYAYGKSLEERRVFVGSTSAVITNIFRHIVGDPTAPPVIQHQARLELIPQPGNKAQRSSEWTPVAKSSEIGGPMDASLVELPRYNLKALRQQLFTWSLHLPYWQGVLLYFLAAIYPFAALIVLIPGRAVSFLNLPLAWLWVKSWDVGIAAVMVFDRVLWNIRPRVALSPAVFGKPLHEMKLYEVVAEASKSDQNWGLNMHYIVLALATMSIPMVTGYATMKSRRAILASFSDKMIGDAKGAGTMLAGAYSTQVMQDRVKAMREWGALAGRSMAYGNSGAAGFEGEGRGSRAGFFASIKGMSQMADNLDSAMFKPGFFSMSKKNPALMKSIATGFRTYADMTEAEFKHDRAHRQAFDKTFGRWGMPRMRMAAWAAAADKSGGFEVDDYTTNAYKEYIDLHAKKVELLADVASDRMTDKLGAIATVAGKGAGAVSPDVAKSISMVLESLGKGEVDEEKLRAAAKHLAAFSNHTFGRDGELRTPLSADSAAEDFLKSTLHYSKEGFARLRTKATYDGEEIATNGRFGDAAPLSDFDRRFGFWEVKDYSPRDHFRFPDASGALKDSASPYLWAQHNGKNPVVPHGFTANDVVDLAASARQFYSVRMGELESHWQKDNFRDGPLWKAHGAMGISGNAFLDTIRGHNEWTNADFQRKDATGDLLKAQQAYDAYRNAANAFFDLREARDGKKYGDGERVVLTPEQFMAGAKKRPELEFEPKPGQTGRELLAEAGPKLLADSQSHWETNFASPFTASERKQKLAELNTQGQAYLEMSIQIEGAYQRKIDENLRAPLVGPNGFLGARERNEAMYGPKK